MGNLFVNLPVPTSNADGAAVDVSAMGATKTIIVGGPFQGTVTIEFSNDDGAAVWAPVPNSSFVNQPGRVTIDLAVKWMRAVMDAYKGGSANADVGAPAALASFAAISVAPVDISAMSSFKTVVSPAANLVEISEDGTSWSQAFSFQNGGGQSAVVVGRLARCLTGMVWMGASPTGDGGSDVEFPQPFTSPDENVIIYARETGDDATGDGKTVGTAYRTLQRAVLDVPLFVPGGVSYYVDVTDLGTEDLPDGYQLPTWKATRAREFDFAAPFFPLKAAVNISADPRLVADLGDNATFTEADLVPTVIGGTIANIAANPVGQSGVGDEITLLGGDIAQLKVAAGVTFDRRAKTITIAGSGAGNDGTFPVVDASDITVLYENAAAAPEGPGGLFTWSTYWYEEPVIEVETTGPHGLWIQPEDIFQHVTIAGVVEGAGEIGNVANGTNDVLWVSPTKFAIFVDGTGLTYGGGPGTVSILIVQDPASGSIELKTTKDFGADDSQVGKLLIGDGGPFDQAVIYHNTSGTLFLTRSFALEGTEFRVMEQSAELITTFSGGSRRGGFNVMNIDSIALNGLRIAPSGPDQKGLFTFGGSPLIQGCAIVAPVQQSVMHDQYVGWSDVVDANTEAWLSHDRALHRGDNTEFLLGSQQQLTSFESVYMDFFGFFVSTGLQFQYGKVLRTVFGFVMFEGDCQLGGVAFEDTDSGLVVGVLGQFRLQLDALTSNALPGSVVLALDQGGVALISTLQTVFSPNQKMAVGTLPPRTFADFYAGVAGPQLTYMDVRAVDPTTGATGRGGAILNH